jgi:hypothetical protein
MAFAAESMSMYFNELTDDLKRIVVDNMPSRKEFIRFMACGKNTILPHKEMQAKKQEFNSLDIKRVVHILHHFTTECIGMENKFKADDVRNAHLDMFLNGYPQSKLLEDEELFKEYNSTFEDLVDDLAGTMRDPHDTFLGNTRIFAEIVNKLRFKKVLNESAKRVLFKTIEDDYVEHALELEFESGIKMNVEITICNIPTDPMRSIDVNAYFVTNKNKKLHKVAYVISGENEEYDFEEEDEFPIEGEPWINNDPTAWIATFLRKLIMSIGGKSMLGGVNNIEYKYHGQQFWEKAYVLLEVLPKLKSM